MHTLTFPLPLSDRCYLLATDETTKRRKVFQLGGGPDLSAPGTGLSMCAAVLKLAILNKCFYRGSQVT